MATPRFMSALARHGIAGPQAAWLGSLAESLPPRLRPTDVLRAAEHAAPWKNDQAHFASKVEGLLRAAVEERNPAARGATIEAAVRIHGRRVGWTETDSRAAARAMPISADAAATPYGIRLIRWLAAAEAARSHGGDVLRTSLAA